MLKEQEEIPIAGRKEASPGVEGGRTKAAEAAEAQLRPGLRNFFPFFERCIYWLLDRYS